MRRDYFKRKLIITATALTLLSCLTAFGQEDRMGPGWADSPAPLQAAIEDLDLPAESDQLVIVEGGEDCEVTVSYYERDSQDWKQVFTTPGLYGKKGGTTEKQEGDKKTPYGLYSFPMAFGLKENPGSVLPYHRITEGDYWVDDSSSRFYNQLVNTKTTKKEWSSAENMAAYAPHYNYGLVLNYNPDCIPYKGSAIFLHCTSPGETAGSAGCVKIPEEYMKTLVQTLNQNARIWITPPVNPEEA